MRVSRQWLIGFRIGEGLISGRRSIDESGNVGRETLRDRQCPTRPRSRHIPPNHLHVIVGVVLVTSLAIHRHILPLTTII